LEIIDIVQTVGIALTLIAAVLVPLAIHRLLLKRVRDEVSQLTRRLDQNLAAGVKLLEVRDYYQQTSAELKKMLDEAYKEGNRFRQDQIRKLMQRLDALKTRALDKTVSILNPQEGPSKRKRRRRPRGRRQRPSVPQKSDDRKSNDQKKGA